MKFIDFIKKLREAALTEPFYLTPGLRIRTKNKDYCPLECVAGCDTPPIEQTIKDLGLPIQAGLEIVKASDNFVGYQRTRAILLEACGLGDKS